jgi:uncharacterized protein
VCPGVIECTCAFMLAVGACVDFNEKRKLKMKRNPMGYFEIAVSNLDRAVTLYSAVFGYTFERTEMDGNQMALFPWHESADGTLDSTVSGIAGALAQGESYVPGQQGCRLYFHTDSIENTLAQAEQVGGKVLYPKTCIGETLGWVAEFEDSEGNCIALNQPPDKQD